MNKNKATSKAGQSSHEVIKTRSFKEFAEIAVYITGEGKLSELDCSTKGGEKFKSTLFEIMGTNWLGESYSIQVWGSHASQMSDFFKFRHEQNDGLGEVFLFPSDDEAKSNPNTLMFRKQLSLHAKQLERKVKVCFTLRTAVLKLKGELEMPESFPTPMLWEDGFEIDGAPVGLPQYWKDACGHLDGSPVKTKREIDFKMMEPVSFNDAMKKQKLF